MDERTIQSSARRNGKAAEHALQVIEHIKQLKGEDVIILHGRPFVVYPADPKDVERIRAGIVLD